MLHIRSLKRLFKQRTAFQTRIVYWMENMRLLGWRYPWYLIILDRASLKDLHQHFEDSKQSENLITRIEWHPMVIVSVDYVHRPAGERLVT